MVDVTYGDNSAENYPRQSHYYFNFGLDRKGSHTWSSQVMNPNNMAQRTNDKYSYYSGRSGRYGTTVKTAAEAAQYCVRQVRNGNKYCEFLIKGKEVTTKALDSALQNTLGKTQGRWYYYYDYLNGNTLIRFNWQEYKKRRVN